MGRFFRRRPLLEGLPGRREAASSKRASISGFPQSGQDLRSRPAPESGPGRADREAPMTKTPAAPASFEAALAELEAIVASMEGGQVPLKEALESYRRGAELLKYCQATLKDAQLEIEVLEKGVLTAFKPDDE